MTRLPVRLVIVACVAGAAVALLHGWQDAPDRDDTLRKLNELLAAHCYNQPSLTFADAGSIVRKDTDGGMMRFKWSDIGELGIDRDGQSHVLLRCRDGKPCVERTTTSGTTMIEYSAFSIYPADMGDAVLQLFRDLKAASARHDERRPGRPSIHP